LIIFADLCVTSRRNPGLGQIQLSFDTTQDLIIDTAFVTQMDCGHTLDTQCLQRKLGMALVIRHSFFSDAGLKTRQAFVIVTDQGMVFRAFGRVDRKRRQKTAAEERELGLLRFHSFGATSFDDTWVRCSGAQLGVLKPDLKDQEA
jgi:hypothetical protein